MPAPHASNVVRFGDFVLDLRTGELLRNGTRIRLQVQPFEVLAFLLRRPGELVTREELREKLWPENTFVDFDDGLNTAVRKLRQALDDSRGHPRYIETLPRRGYRFLAPVLDGSAPKAQPALGLSERVIEEPASAAREEVLTEALSAAPAHRKWAPWATAALIGLVVVLVAVGARYLWERRQATLTPVRIRSLAVLPLENLGGDPAQDYFANGMTELLTTDLGRTGDIRVISRTSAMRYKGMSKTIPEIARELNVEAVIEGGVARSGNRLRITVQLIRAKNERHLWANAYEGDVRDAFSLQDKVAVDIAERVEAQFSGAGRSTLAGAATLDPVAEEEYFRGRYDSSRWTAAELESSIGHFEQAVQADPRCAPAWAGLAGDYELMGGFGYLPRRTALAQARTAARRAVELDSSLADAHVFLAAVRWPSAWLPSGNGDLARQAWLDAEKELRLAIALNPNEAVAHQWLGYHLAAAGQFESAIAEMKRARELDPLSPNTQNSLGAAYYWAGRDEAALREFLQVPDPDANSERRHQRMARIYERKRMIERAAAELAAAARFAGQPALAASVERQYRLAGYAQARRLYLRGDIIARQRHRENDAVPLAALEIAADYALNGEAAPSLRWLERAWQQDDPGLEYLKIDDRFETLHANPRFQDLLVRLGLPRS